MSRVGVCRLLGVLGASLTLIACQAIGNAPKHSQLLGTWQLETVGGAPIVESTWPRVTFSDEGLSGNASCNRFFGNYQYHNGTLAVTQLASTKMLCQPSVMEQENRVLALLVQTAQVEVHQEGRRDVLQLLDDDGSVLIRARRAESDN